MGVCDPSSHACVYANCGDGLATCGRLKVCRPFIENGPVGICLTYCHDSSECPEGITCTHLQNTSMGLCLLAGKGNPDEACQPSPWTTGCAAGYRCVDDPTPLCRADCRPLAESRTCTSPTVCTVNGACEHTAEVDPASLGESCSPDSDMGTSCALEDGHSRGVCTFKIYQEYAVGPLCIELCHDTSGCPDGVSCTRGMVRDRDVGVCVNLSP